jgi:hypothetical protein
MTRRKLMKDLDEPEEMATDSAHVEEVGATTEASNMEDVD